jgi:2-C-methyl-D-erythritol 4-phosphate cytidylyltransferase
MAAAMSSPDTAVVIVAGGTGTRFGRAGGKQLAALAGRPVFSHSFAAAASVDRVGLVVVACPPDRIEEYATALAADAPRIEFRFVASGERRQDSVASGLAEVPDSFAYVVVHDGARPLAGPELFDRTLDLLDASPELAGAVVGHPSVDTLKTVDAGRVAGTPERSRYWTVQTPQAFRAGALRAAYDEAAERGREGTDDASLVEAVGGAIGLVEGPRDNIKVTLAEDLAVAEALLSVRAEGSC